MSHPKTRQNFKEGQFLVWGTCPTRACPAKPLPWAGVSLVPSPSRCRAGVQDVTQLPQLQLRYAQLGLPGRALCCRGVPPSSKLCCWLCTLLEDTSLAAFRVRFHSCRREAFSSFSPNLSFLSLPTPTPPYLIFFFW